MQKSEAKPTTTPKPKKGKGSAVLIRVTQETRDALDLEAERTGRSLSALAEMWLEEARKGRAIYADRLGGIAPAAAIEGLADAAVLIAEELGDVTKDAKARAALLAAWRLLAPGLLPLPMQDLKRRELARSEVSLMNSAAALAAALAPGIIAGRGPIDEAAIDCPSSTEAMDRLAEGLDLVEVHGYRELIQNVREAINALKGLESERLKAEAIGSMQGKSLARRLLQRGPLDEVE